MNYMINCVAFKPPGITFCRESDVKFLNISQNTKIATRIIKPNTEIDNKRIILFSHGNATDIGCGHSGSLEYSQWLSRNLQTSVCIWDPPGYGLSSDEPTTEALLRKSIMSVYEDVVAEGYEKVYLLGKSIGSVAAIWLGAQHYCTNIRGVILVSPLASGWRVLSVYNYMKMFSPWLDEIFANNIKYIKCIECPVLIMHGRQDQIVPVHNALDLFQAANSHTCRKPPSLYGSDEFPVGHNNIETDRSIEFLDEVASHIEFCETKKSV